MYSITRSSDLHVLLQTTNAEARILHAIRCPNSGEGLVRALELVEKSLSALARQEGLPRANHWRDACSGLHAKCQALEATHTYLSSLPKEQKPRVFERLARPPQSQLFDVASEKSMAVLGHLIAAAVSKNEELSVVPIDAWATLHRGNASGPDWIDIVEAIPQTKPEVDAALKWVKVQGLRTLLQEFQVALATPLTEPSSAINAPTSAGASTRPAAESPNECHSVESKEDVDEMEEPASNPKVKRRNYEQSSKISPTGWLIKQAIHALHTQLFGLIGDRDRLHPDYLQSVCKGLMSSFETGGKDERDFVSVSHLSLKSGLPANLVIHLPLHPVSYPWVDLAHGEIVWNYRLALESNSDSPVQLPSRSNVELIQIALDANVIEHLRAREFESPGSCGVGALFRIASGTEAVPWLKAYRKFLRGHGDVVHPAYDARFSRSLGDVYRHVCGSDMAASFLAQDFQACAMGLLHYSTLPAAYLQDCTKKVDKFLGFRSQEAERKCGVKGALISITRDEFVHGWSKLQLLTGSALDSLASATSVERLIEAFNSLANARLLCLITLVAHRGSRLSRLTWRALYSHQTLIHIFDKDVGKYQSHRVVPAHSLVDQLLACWQEDLKLLRQRASALGMSVREKGRRAINEDNAHQPAFFQLQSKQEGDAACCITRRPIGNEGLTSMAQLCFDRPLNIGRHFLVSELLTKNIDTWLIQVLTGHARSHAEPFSDGMGMPPKIALERIRAEIDKLFAALDLSVIASIGHLPDKRRLALPSGRVPPISGDGYLHPRIGDGLRILPPPFDEHTVVAIQLVDEARAEILRRASPLEAGPTLVTAMTLFDALDPDDQRIIFGNLQSAAVLIRNTTWFTWNREKCSHEICLPLTPVSVLALTKLDRSSPGIWDEHAASVGSWIRVRFPRLQWPDNDLDAYEALAAMALRWRRYQCSPSVLTAQSCAIPAATPSRHSMLRIATDLGAQKTPAPSKLGKAIRLGSKKFHNKSVGLLKLVADRLRDVAGRSKQLGEGVARAKILQIALQDIDTDSDLRAANLKSVILHEVKLNLDNSPDSNDFGTLAGYLADVLLALELLDSQDDLEDFTGEEIRDWVACSKVRIDDAKDSTNAVKDDKPRYFGLKRFLSVGSLLGWDVPKDLFGSVVEHGMFDGLRKSAASCVILERDHCEIHRLLLDHFEDWPVLAKLATLTEDILRNAPLRSSEQIVLRKDCIVSSIGSLAIESDGFSHLKSKHATRLIKLPESLCDRISQTLDEPDDSFGKYLFIENNAADWATAKEIDEALISAATQVTGDASLRKHSFRAAAISNRVWPSWECVAKALLDGSWSPAQHHHYLRSACDRGFPHFINGTREAGHGHPLVTLVYYCAPWQFILGGQISASLVGIEPSGSLISDALQSTDCLRTARSRAKSHGEQFDTWGHIAKHCTKKANFPRLVALSPAAIITPRSTEGQPQEQSLMALVRFSAEILLGGSFNQCAQKHGLALPIARRLESLIPFGAERATLVKRRRGDPGGDSLKEDRLFLNSEWAIPLIESLVASPPANLRRLGEDLSPARPNARSSAPGATAMLKRINEHLACLPSTDVSLQIRFSSTYPRVITTQLLASFHPRLVVGSDNSRIGAHPLFQIVDRSCVANARAAGKWTVVTRVLVAAVQSVLLLTKGE